MTTQPSASSGKPSSSRRQPVVIGIYGLPGCGKSFLLRRLTDKIEGDIDYYESSQVIAAQVPGGLDTFQAMSKEEKKAIREAAVKLIHTKCVDENTQAVIAGHYSFWDPGQPQPDRVMTEEDLNSYTHIIYLETLPKTILRNREEDTERTRATVSAEHLNRWQQLEISELRVACYKAGIIFSVISGTLEDPAPFIIPRILAFTPIFEAPCLEGTFRKLKRIVNGSGKSSQLKTALVFDADKTLAAEDSGKLFWQSVAEANPDVDKNVLKAVFSSNLGYSFAAFYQAMLLYVDAADDGLVDSLCGSIAKKIRMYRDILSLLREATGHPHIIPIVVTCGLDRIWEEVLRQEGLSGKVRVIGGGLLEEGIVTPETKAEIVAKLQTAYGLKVWAFGDSPLDIPMLKRADHAIIVVGDEMMRSKSMDAALMKSGIQARQVLMNTSHPRLDITSLPVVQLTDPEVIKSIMSRECGSRLFHATARASAKLLMTPTRDSTIAGPALREAHRRVGLYLATEFVTEVVGLTPFCIQHVQGHPTLGYGLHEEKGTLIVALMRAGEPMALGINDAFPLAKFRHAKEPDDIAAQHVQATHTILLVDAVVNNGDTAVKFIKHIRGLAPTVKVVVVAGVVQSQCVSAKSGNKFAALHEGDPNISLVALRISENKFKGVGGADTGNRLFNTTHLK